MRKSVPPTNSAYIPPFRNKKVAAWNPDDVSDWIQSIETDAGSKTNFAQAVVVNRVTGKILKRYRTGKRIYNDFNQYGVTEKFCNVVCQQLRNILNIEEAVVYPNLRKPKNVPASNVQYIPPFGNKPVKDWDTDDIGDWIDSIEFAGSAQLQRQDKKIFKKAVASNQLTGQLLMTYKNGKRLHDDLDYRGVGVSCCNKVIEQLKVRLATESGFMQPSGSNTKRIENWSNDDLLNWVKDIGLESKWENIITEIITSTGCTGKEWLAAKNYKGLAKSLGIKQTMLANRVFREFRKVKEAHVQDDNDDELPSYTDVKPQKRREQRIVYWWETKHIDGWDNKELQEWICSLNLGRRIEKQVVEAIEEQEITGEDFNSLTDIEEVQDSFEISQPAAKKIYDAMKNIRRNSKDSNVNVSSDYNTGSVSVKTGRCIIGLDNLRNTCFINSVIQALLQTPGLVPYLRKYTATYGKEKSDVMFSGWFGGGNQLAVNMLEAFIEVAAAAMQSVNRYDSMAPKAIVQLLRNSDVKFAYGEQGDPLSAVSKMLELLDKDIIKKEKSKGKKKNAKRHTGSWVMDMKDNDDEDEIIEGNCIMYNPYESPIRDGIHFVERNLFTCMKCGWQEARYDIKEKILLPLKDHSTKIFIDIYIPSIKVNGPALSRHECVILGYCPIQTLRYQIFNEIQNKDIQFDMKNVDQISIRTVKVDKNKLLSEWIEECDAKEDCSILTRTNGSIFAVVDSSKRSRNSITVTTFNVRFDKKGEADPKASYLEFDEMKAGQKKSFDTTPDDRNYPKKHMHIYFDQQIHGSDYECQITHRNATVVVMWTHVSATQRCHWQQPDIQNVDLIWQCFIWNQSNGNISNYSDCIQVINDQIEGCTNFSKTLDSTTRKSFRKQYIDNSLTAALAVYEGLVADQTRAIELVYNAFATGKESFMKKNPIVEDIIEGFETYCSTKVMDRGAVFKCRGQCGGKRVEVFKIETKIVRFSDVLIFAIDRYISGEQFEDVVEYNEFEIFDKNKYELYAVCNHSGGLGYGHYWAFVKGYNDNKWYQANDSRISRMDVRDVVHKETATLLFYKRKSK